MPKPRSGESKSQFVTRCVSVRKDEHPTEKTDKSVAVCHAVWREHKKGGKD